MPGGRTKILSATRCGQKLITKRKKRKKYWTLKMTLLFEQKLFFFPFWSLLNIALQNVLSARKNGKKSTFEQISHADALKYNWNV